MERRRGAAGGRDAQGGFPRPAYPFASLLIIALVLLGIGLGVGSLAGALG
ncbi:MAG: hypothetical protein JNK22_15870 [Rhodocyclaceae bacterium]|nr:hypothetical protein [Rhodocyclaceae bacterium]